MPSTPSSILPPGSGPDLPTGRDGSEPAFSVHIPGKPIAKKRPRFARVGKGVRTYSAQETEEGRVMWEIKTAWDRAPLDRPLYVEMYFGMYIPKSTSLKRRLLMLRGDIKHIKKPDLDNLQKFYKDAMNKIVWRDDSQVCEVKVSKFYADEPFTFIKVWGL